MGRHPSLKFSSIDAQYRNVLKRGERIKLLKEQGKLEEYTSMFGLPKIKRIRIKGKKEKAEEKAKPSSETTTPETK